MSVFVFEQGKLILAKLSIFYLLLCIKIRIDYFSVEAVFPFSLCLASSVLSCNPRRAQQT